MEKGNRGEGLPLRESFFVACRHHDRSDSFFDADYADEKRIVADKRITAVPGHAYLRQSAVHLRNLRSWVVGQIAIMTRP